MTKRLFVIALWAAHAVVWAIGTLVHHPPHHHQQQQSWQLPVEAISAHPVPEPIPHSRHTLSSSRVQIWSLSTNESHQRAFSWQPRRADPAPTASSSGFSANAAAAAAELKWSLSNANGSIRIDALFPSLAHLDLLRAGLIDEPSIGLNEGLYRWIADEPSWSYTASLKPILQHLDAARHRRQYWLHFQGLDTIAQIFVGGQLIGEAHNQHKWHAFRVPPHLLEHSTTNLTLVFSNANEYAAQQSAKHNPGYPNQVVSPTRSRTSDYEYPNRIFVRKQQSDFGWDWGPALVPAGPFKPAYLIALPGRTRGIEAAAADAGEILSDAEETPSVLVIASGVDIYRKGQTNNLPPPDPHANWIVNVTLTLLSSRDVPWPSLRLSIPSLGLYTFDTLLSCSRVSAGLNPAIYATFEIPSEGEYGPSLWWPRGYGEQILYELVVHSDELDIEVRKRVGFRTAVFDLGRVSPQEAQQGVQPGSHFRLLINDRQVYVMGTNMIPFDTLAPRLTPAYLGWLLDSALHAHVNLIRVWGGGAYPSQELLDKCDELGIMVWMDAMFAASLYPYHPEFLHEVGGEVQQVMVDVVAHPSVVMVVGNNEGELYFLGGYGRRRRDAEWKRGYESLFDGVIRDRVREASRGMSYIPCSTTTGYLELDPYRGRYDRYPKHVELHGTGEHYGYDAAKAFEIDTYPSSRFMVEFGMFSLPSIHTLDRILQGGGDYSLNSSVLRAHLKHPPAGNLTYPFSADQGQHELVTAISTYFPSPRCACLRTRLHRYARSSQLYHALYLANQIAVYRRQAGRRERNRGLVVWQFNDVWEGTSWSSIEYAGAWKMAQYALVEVQSPVVALAVYDDKADRLDVEVVWSGASRGGGGAASKSKSETDEVSVKVTVRMEWFDFTGRALRDDQVHVTLNTTVAGSQTISTFHRPDRTIGGGGHNDHGRFLRLTTLTSDAQSTTVVWTPMHHLGSTVSRLSARHLRPRLELTQPAPADTSDPPASTVHVRNTGNATAPYVFVEHAPPSVGFFASCHAANGTQACYPCNGFWLAPGEEKVLTFVHAAPPEQTSASKHQQQQQDRQHWLQSVSAWSLFDNLDA